jgi:prefoldin subunit 5
MDTSNLREEFEKQLKDYEFQIKKGEQELAKLREYKTKLEGGLETLDLLEKQNGSDSSQHTD